MASVISLEEFKNLKEGSLLKDKDNNAWAVQYINCTGPKHYPTIFLKCPTNGEFYRVYHDGVSMYISGENEKNKNGIIKSFEEDG